jgi:hypothetical protein
MNKHPEKWIKQSQTALSKREKNNQEPVQKSHTHGGA